MPASMYIVGPVVYPAYADKLTAMADSARDISLRIGDWLSPADLRLWLARSTPQCSTTEPF